MQEYQEFRSEFNDKYSLVSRKILRALSENARISISDLSKQLELSRKTTKDRILRLEKELGIRYTLELDEDKLGIGNPHLIMLRFGKKPSNEAIKAAFSRSHIPQVVARVNGSYDMFVYANAQRRDEYVHWDKSMQISLAEYGVSWYPSEVAHKQLGFYPIRNELIERMEMAPKHKAILKALNANSRSTFQEISKQTGLHFNTVAYNYKSLLELGYIKRFTLVMRKPANLTLVALFDKYRISDRFEEDAKYTRYMFKADDDNSMISRFILVNELVGANDFFGAGIFDSAEMAQKGFVNPYRKMHAPDKANPHYGTVESVILGDLPIRSLETRKAYSTLVWKPQQEEGQ